jgi:two-component system, cell cycle response regulator DivK
VLRGIEVSLPAEHPLVLLVEDDREGRLMYAEWLQLAGFRVEQAHNGLQALERAFDLLPAAIVTDLNIPGIDGYELTRRLRADERTTRIPIIAVTGYAPFTQDPSRADRAGCDAISPKPCLPDDLESTIRSLLADGRHSRSA